MLFVVHMLREYINHLRIYILGQVEGKQKKISNIVVFAYVCVCVCACEAAVRAKL